MAIKTGDYITFCTNGVFKIVDKAGIPQGERTPALGRSPASIMRYYIVNTMMELTLPTDKMSWPCYVSHLPDNDKVEDDAACLYDTTGLKDGKQMAGSVLVHQGIQLKIRSRNYETGYAKIEEIYTMLDAINYELIEIDDDSYELEGVRRIGDANYIGTEPRNTKRRFLFTVNFTLTLRKIV